MALLCLWFPWFCGVPGLHVRSPVSGRVCVLPQSAIVTLLSLLWVGLLLALVRGSLPQADAVGFGLRWSGRLSSLLAGRSCSFDLGSSSLDLVVGGGFHCVPSPLSSFRMWSPFGVNSVFCHYWSRTKVFIGGGFFCEVASHLGVVQLFSYVLCRFVVAPSGWWPRFYLACHCTCQYPIFSWLPLLLSQVT